MKLIKPVLSFNACFFVSICNWRIDTFSLADSIVPVQAWDHHMKDGYTRNKPEATNGKSKSSWDGSRKSNVVADLEAMSSSHGFGNAGKRQSILKFKIFNETQCG